MKISTVTTYLQSYFSSGPSYIILYITNRCNQKCKFCFYADSLNAPSGDFLTLEEIEKVGQSVYPCIQWTLSGGETFIRKDLVDIVITLIKYAGARNITFTTNGSLTDRIIFTLEKLCKEYPFVDFRIGLSIDGLEEKHDAIRGMQGAFQKAEHTFHEIKKLQKHFFNLHLSINTVASKYNKDSLKKFIDYAVENLWCDDHSLTLVRGITRGQDAKNISPLEYQNLVSYFERRKAGKFQAETFHKKLLKFIETETRAIVNKTFQENAFQITCVAGMKLAVLYDSGSLYPCEIIQTLNWPESVKKNFGGNFEIGNVRDFDYNVNAMIKSGRGKALYEFIVSSKCFCTFECSIAASIVFNLRTLLKTVFSPLSSKAYLARKM